MKLIITSTLLFLAFSPLVQAKHDRSDQSNREHSHGALNTKVMNVTPVYKYLTDRHPQAYCEPAVIDATAHRSHDKSAALVGGILGGLIGHAASNNQHKGLGKLNPKSIFVLMTR